MVKCLFVKPYTSILIILLVACYLSCGEKNNKNGATTVKQDTLSINKTSFKQLNNLFFTCILLYDNLL